MDPADRAGEIEERQRAAAGVDRQAVVKRPYRLSPTCADCGHVIVAQRLALVPDARRCTSCQQEQEEREGRVA